MVILKSVCAHMCVCDMEKGERLAKTVMGRSGHASVFCLFSSSI